MVRVTVEPLYTGGRGSGGSHAAILRLGRLSLLMNCGATDRLDPRDIEPLLPHLSDVDSIFISHGSLRHLGGLPLLHSRQKPALSRPASPASPGLCCCFSGGCRECSVPAFLTQASQRLGKVALESAVLSNAQNRGVCTAEDAQGGGREAGAAGLNALKSSPTEGGSREERGEGEEKCQEAGAAGEPSAAQTRKGDLPAGTILSADPPVSLKDVATIMEACRVLRYEERVRLFPRKRERAFRGHASDEVGEGAEATGAEAAGRETNSEAGDSVCRDEEDEDSEEDETEVYVHCISAGHALGGAVWLFDADGRKIIFAVDHCLNPLWHVDGSALLSLIPTVLAAPSTPSPSPSFSSPSRDAFSSPCLFVSDVHEPPTGIHSWRTSALRALFLQIAQVLQRGGDVIIPMDVGSPLLELLLHLEALWRLAPSLHGFPVFLISPVSVSFLLACRPLLPQSTQRARAVFASQRINPLFSGSSASLSSLVAAHRLAAASVPGKTKNSHWLVRKQTAEEAAEAFPIPLQAPKAAQEGAGDSREKDALIDGSGEHAAATTALLGAAGVPATAAVWSPTSGLLPTPAPGPLGGLEGMGDRTQPAANAGARREPGAQADKKGDEGGEGSKAESGAADANAARGALMLGPALVPAAARLGLVGAVPAQGAAGAGACGGGVPFGNLKFVRLLSTEREVESLLQQKEGKTEEGRRASRRPPCVFICVPASLDSGFGRSLLIREAERAENVFFFLSEPWPGTTAHRVWRMMQESSCSGSEAPVRPEAAGELGERTHGLIHDSSRAGAAADAPELLLTQTRSVALSADELLRLFEREKERREREAEEAKKRQRGDAGETAAEAGAADGEGEEGSKATKEGGGGGDEAEGGEQDDADAQDAEIAEDEEEPDEPLLLRIADEDLVDYSDDEDSAFVHLGAQNRTSSFFASDLAQGEGTAETPRHAESPREETADEAREGEGGDVKTEGDDGPAGLEGETASLDEASSVGSDGDSDWAEPAGPAMEGDRDDFAQPELFTERRRTKKAKGEQTGRLDGKPWAANGDTGVKKEGKEETEEFGIPVSAEQKTIWTAATLSMGTTGSAGAADAASAAKSLWEGGLWGGNERLALANGFALPASGAFGAPGVYRHLAEGERLLAGAPRRRQERIKAQLRLATSAGGGGHLPASPWSFYSSSLMVPSAFGLSSPSPLMGANGLMGSSPFPTAGAAYRLQERALPAWRRQLRQWCGGADPTGLESHTVRVPLRCRVQCFSGGLEGVTSLQGLLSFLSLLRPQNVFLLPSTSGSLASGFAQRLGQRGERSRERGDGVSSHFAVDGDGGVRGDLQEGGAALGPPSGAEALQVDLGHRLVSDLLASLGPQTRVQLLLPSWPGASSLFQPFDAARSFVSNVGVLDLPSGQAVLCLDRRLWAELQAHAVPVPTTRSTRATTFAGAVGLQGARKRGHAGGKRPDGADRGEERNWGQRLCFVARARGTLQPLADAKGQDRGARRTSDGGAVDAAPQEAVRSRKRSRCRRFGSADASFASTAQAGSFWCPSLRPSFRLVASDPTVSEAADAPEDGKHPGGEGERHSRAMDGLEEDGKTAQKEGDSGAASSSASHAKRRLFLGGGDDGPGGADRGATLLLGRLHLGDVADLLRRASGCEGGEDAAGTDAEEERGEIAFAPQGKVLTLADCAAIRVIQDGHGSRAALWEIESSVNPCFFYLRRLFASQPFALPGS
ncbi:hypothetical protein BESB_040030 [Besnoitia besnoiti]|uniref:Cleavage and polyadenylation specificity factor subunit 2 n=1 Tax=Besnoitia besnoiti TaxID=94643 RepID=A0A2A9MHT2_BESBE|nr:hypothetical protein BESB_040030 [Besnoitia besnoiti]PFH37545.1 hypothetical protein BESB_040030 [Besnoitia besnoiti]